MALKQPQHYVRKTFELKDLEMAKSFSDRAFLGISENVSGHHETLVSQFFSGEASTQVKNLFLIGLWPARDTRRIESYIRRSVSTVLVE
eukprot:c25363_g1_i3 orf=105-371(+)